MVNLIDLFHQKIELFRLEQRYTRRRNRRSTFVSEAQYVDGEYIYTNSNTSSKQNTGNSGSGSGSSDSEIDSPVSRTSDNSSKEKDSMGKGLGSKRLSRMGMAMDWRKGKHAGEGESGGMGGGQRVNVREVRWDGNRRT